jgi:hypothetical protein
VSTEPCQETGCDCQAFQRLGSRYVLREDPVLGIHGVTLCGRCDHPESTHHRPVEADPAR